MRDAMRHPAQPSHNRVKVALVSADRMARDYLDTVKRRVVIFDGGMGATLEQFDLTQEDYMGLQGKCHEALVLNRPDVIEGVHSSFIEAGADVLETDTFQASRIKLEEWGLAEHTLEINTKAAEIARKAAGEDKFVAGSIGPTGHLPASDDPTLGKITFGELVEVFTEQATGLVKGGVGPPDHRDRPGHPGGEGRHLRRARRVQGDRPDAADPVLCVAASQRRQDAAGHRHRGRAHHAHRAGHRRARPELLHRPRGHARRDPLPRRALAAAGALHPQRGHPDPGPGGRDDLPRGARAAGQRAPGLRRAPRRGHRGRLLRHHAGAHRRHRGACEGPRGRQTVPSRARRWSRA